MTKGIFSHKSLTNTKEESPEHDLWVSVLSKAAHDALHGCDWRESRLAISWFKGAGSNFKQVCEYAGHEPKYVHRRMELPIKRREKEMETTRW